MKNGHKFLIGMIIMAAGFAPSWEWSPNLRQFTEAVEKLASDSFRADRGPKARARRKRRRSFTHSGRRSLSAPFLYLRSFFVRFFG
jgi:hypothetical protein